MFVLWLLFLLAAMDISVYGQQGLPFQVNSKQTCETQISIDTTTLTGVKRGDDNAPCSGYLMYTDAGTTRRMCGETDYGMSEYSAERACYTLGVNFYRDSNVFDSSTTRQMKLFRCFAYREQGVDSVEVENRMEIFYTYDLFEDWKEAVCTDADPNPAAYNCFDTCYFTSPKSVNAPVLGTEDGCYNGEPFFTIGCADINECQSGVQDYCTGPYESSCTIRTACGNNTDCTNHPGSFECSCKNGFEYRSGDSLDPYDLNEGCKDVDECTQSKCHADAKCVNTVGSYLCWCKDGFTGNGKTCTPITCNFLPELPNTIYKFPVYSQSFGDTAVCECDDGYKVSLQNLPETLVTYYGYTKIDSFILTCDEKGDWGPDPFPQCIPVECGDPGVILNADRVGTGFMYKQEVTYTCEDGYKQEKYSTIGSFTKKCQDDGTWTAGTTCVDIDECQQSDVCTDLEYCINTKGGYLCLVGIPDNCDIQGFCNNGECQLMNGRAECVCDEGYNGLRCETPITSTAFTLAIVGLVISGVLSILLLVVLCMWCSTHPRTHHAWPPQNLGNPVIGGRAPFSTKQYGFRRPPFAPAPNAAHGPL